MPEYLILIIVGLAVLGLFTLLFGLFSSLARRAFGVAAGIFFALLCILLAVMLGTLSLSMHGYRMLTHEEVAATVDVRPVGDQQFLARFDFPDGREETYQIAGDQLYVDAHILKWKPWANILGLHTAYQLDRVTGRYVRLDDEMSQPRTVYPLSPDSPVNLFDLRQQYAMLESLVDAGYGSGTFQIASSPATYEIRISTSGLLIRPVDTPRTP